jgi:hypothetical protein
VIYDAAAMAERNDLNGVMEIILPDAGEVKAEARHWIGQAKIESVSISAMEVTVDRTKKPMTATAEFRVFAIGQITEQHMTYPAKYLGRLHVDLRQSGGRWLVTSYQRDN